MYCQLIVHIFYSYIYIPHRFQQTYVEVFTSVHCHHVMKEVHWDPLMSMTEQKVRMHDKERQAVTDTAWKNMLLVMSLRFMFRVPTQPEHFLALIQIHHRQQRYSTTVCFDYYYYYWYSALGPVWAETRAQSGDWYGSGTLHPGQVLRGSLPLLSPCALILSIKK